MPGRALLTGLIALALLGASEAASLVVDPRNPRTLYAAGERGVKKSVDGGASWTAPRNEGLPSHIGAMSFELLAIDGANPGALYAVASSTGLFIRSTDGGETWQLLSPLSPPPSGVRMLAVDPRTPTTLYAVDGAGKIHKSIDGGLTWLLSSTGVSDAVSGLAIAPGAPDVLYAVMGRGAVAVSTDAGATWRAAGPGIASRGITALAIDARDPLTVYAGTGDQGVFRSVDGGASWTLADRGLTNKIVSGLAVDPRAPSTVYAVAKSFGTAEVFRSRDRGERWRRVGIVLSSSIDFETGLALVSDPGTPGTLYLSPARGRALVFKSVDSGATWRRANAGLANLAVARLAVNPARPGVLYASVWVEDEFGVFKSSNGGASWRRSDRGLDHHTLILDVAPGSPGTVYAGTNMGLFRSEDGGARWKLSGFNPPHGDRIGALAVYPRDPATLYAGTLNGGVFKSGDAGRHWSPAGHGSGKGSVQSIALDPRDPATLYAIFFDGGAASENRDSRSGVFKSIDGGGSWIRSDAGLPPIVEQPNQLVLDPREPRRLFALIAGAGVFVTRDGGGTWAVRNGDLPAGDVRALRIAGDSTLFAVTTDGAYKTVDGGERWKPINARPVGQPTPTVGYVVTDPRNPRVVYAGTSTHGAFKSTDGGEHWRPINRGLVASGSAASVQRRQRPSPPRSIAALGGALRENLERIGVGERTTITRGHADGCNTCDVDALKISPTQYVESMGRCTLIGCGGR